MRVFYVKIRVKILKIGAKKAGIGCNPSKSVFFSIFSALAGVGGVLGWLVGLGLVWGIICNPLSMLQIDLKSILSLFLGGFGGCVG